MRRHQDGVRRMKEILVEFRSGENWDGMFVLLRETGRENRRMGDGEFIIYAFCNLSRGGQSSLLK